MDKVTEVMTKCFSKSYRVEVHAALGVLDLDPISKIETYIFLVENLTYKEMFFGCLDHERKCVLLTLMSKPKNLKSGIFLPTLVLEWIMLFYFVLARLITKVFFFLDICLHF